MLSDIPSDCLFLETLFEQLKTFAPLSMQVIGASTPCTTFLLLHVLVPPMLRAQSNHSPSLSLLQLTVPSLLEMQSTSIALARTRSSPTIEALNAINPMPKMGKMRLISSLN